MKRFLARGAGVMAAAGVMVLLGPAGAAMGQAEDLTVKGSVSGELVRGRRVTFRVTSTHPEGFAALHSLTVIADLRGASLEELSYDVDEGSISLETGKAIVGTGDEVTGRFFRVGALGVNATTGGDQLTLAFTANVLEDLPQGTRFQFIAEDDLGAEATTTVRASVPEEEGGLSLAAVALAIGAALLAGGFFGAQFGSRRRPAGPSIYGTVARRVQEEREARTRGRPE